MATLCLTSPNSVAAPSAGRDEKTTTKLKLASVDYLTTGYARGKLVPTGVKNDDDSNSDDEDDELPGKVRNPFSLSLCEEVLPGALSGESIEYLAKEMRTHSAHTLPNGPLEEDDAEIVRKTAYRLITRFKEMFEDGVHVHGVWKTLTESTEFRVFFSKAGGLGNRLGKELQLVLGDKVKELEKDKRALRKEVFHLRAHKKEVKRLKERAGDLELMNKCLMSNTGKWEQQSNVLSLDIQRLRERVKCLKETRAATSAATTGAKPAKKKRERPVTPRRDRDHPFKRPRSSEHAGGAAQ
jgi:hypothetical protein